MIAFCKYSIVTSHWFIGATLGIQAKRSQHIVMLPENCRRHIYSYLEIKIPTIILLERDLFRCTIGSHSDFDYRTVRENVIWRLQNIKTHILDEYKPFQTSANSRQVQFKSIDN